MTTTLEDIAFNNLKFLNDKEDFLANRYTLKKQQLIKEDDDTVYTLTDLEYPLFFTFHQLINHVHSSYEPRFHGKTKKELLDMFQVAIETINEYYVETDNSNQEFETLIDDIEDKVFFVTQYYRYGWCNRLPTIVKDAFSSLCMHLIYSSRIIVDEYISDLKDPGSYESIDEESTDEDIPDLEDEEEEEDGEEDKKTN
jgi:hypothetical protein|tara:strand:- start:120 stop:713 length:594 start_codon:yes stop_codon:yes gene_type:complete